MDLDVWQWGIVFFACAGTWLLIQVLLRELVPQRVETKLVGNGRSLVQAIDALTTVQVEQMQMRRGPILGTVQEDGRTIQLHMQVACVTEDGRGIVLDDRQVPGSTLGLWGPAT